jgi:hypothetical protein
MAKTIAQLTTEIEQFKQTCDNNQIIIERKFKVIDSSINELNKHVRVLEANAAAASKPQQQPTLAVPTIAAPTIPFPTATPTTSIWQNIYDWYNQKWSTAFKLFFWCVLAIIAYQIYHSGVIGNTVSKYLPIPSIVKPTIDPNSVEGVAYAALQKEPYYSDTTSKRAFADILSELDSLVANDDIKDLEGYFNQFGKLTQAKLKQKDYQNWGSFWNGLIPEIQSRTRNNNVQTFNEQLQKVRPLLQPQLQADPQPLTQLLP